MVTWGFATLAYNPEEALLEGIVDAALQQLPEMQPQAVANTMWGLAKLEVKNCVPLCTAIAQTVPQSVGEYRWQELCNLLWAFSCLRYRPDDLLVAVEARLQDQEMGVPGAPSPVDWASLAWAFATLVCLWYPSCKEG
jgi:hypothetical protein